MNMNTRKLVLNVAMLAALSCTTAHGQVLGGNIGGGLGGTLNGTLGGGAGELTSRGGVAGSLSGDMDAHELRRTTRGTVHRSVDRVRDAGSTVGNRAGRTLQSARSTTANAAASGAAELNEQAQGAMVATNAAGSLAGNASSRQLNLSGAGDASSRELSLSGAGDAVTGSSLSDVTNTEAVQPTVPADGREHSPTLPNIGGDLAASGSSDAHVSKRGVSAQASGNGLLSASDQSDSAAKQDGGSAREADVAK
jgi:hypothetical protein